MEALALPVPAYHLKCPGDPLNRINDSMWAPPMRSSLTRRPAQPDQRQHGGFLLCDQALPGDQLNQLSDSMEVPPMRSSLTRRPAQPAQRQHGGSSYAIKPHQETSSTGSATAWGSYAIKPHQETSSTGSATAWGSSYAIKPYQETCSTGLATA